MNNRPFITLVLLAGVLVVPAPAAFAATPTTERVSVASDGTQADGGSYDSVFSADGRYLAFSSSASNLVAGDTNDTTDVFVSDRVSGVTTRVSVTSDGTQADSFSVSPQISANGRYVAFYTSASNLAPGDTNGMIDVFVHDRVTGATNRVSVASDGTQADGGSTHLAISADGGYVAFASSASNLVAGDTNATQDVFVHSRNTGATTRVSVASDGTQAGDLSVQPVISADGRYVAFFSQASNLVPGDTNGNPSAVDGRDVFVHDRVTGATTRVSVASDGTQADGFSSARPAITADGRYVAFISRASNLVPGDTNARDDVFVHDRVTGVTTRVSVASDGAQSEGYIYELAINADGRYVAFSSSANNLAPGDTNARENVFVHDRVTGVTTQVSVASDGTPADGGGEYPALTADGRYVAFTSRGGNLVAGDTNDRDDVFVHDRGVADVSWATIATPPDGIAYSLNQVVFADFVCTDPAVVQCIGTVPNGSAIDTSTAGSHSFVVSTVDGAGYASTQSVSYTVLAGNVSAVVADGGTITTDPGNVGASADVPLQTSITLPAGLSGTLSVTPRPTTTGAPAGFSLFGNEVVLEGPAATSTAPHQVTFTVDSSALNGISPADVQVFRNGLALTGCTDPTAAVPDPCIASRGFAQGGGGDALVTVRTSQFSTWSLGRLSYTLTGPFQPVDAAPAVNTAKAGSAIPVKFKLGGDKGLSVLADGYPKSGTASCGSAARDEIEQTLNSAASALTYDPVSTQYTFKWKTNTTMKGCRDLVLRFRDGSELRAMFNLR